MTPSSNWSQKGESDTLGDRSTGSRHELTLGNLTDDQLANSVFLHNHREVNVGVPTSFALLLAAKERILWLSRQASWPTDKVSVLGEPDAVIDVGTHAFFKSLVQQLEWNALPDLKLGDRQYKAFEVCGIIVEEGDEDKDNVQSVPVGTPGVTQWGVYGKNEDLWWALHDCDSLEDAMTRAGLLAKVYG